ncbi:MAG TPA: glycosyltransferase family 39 protein, partial [Pseudomonadales bacterium]
MLARLNPQVVLVAFSAVLSLWGLGVPDIDYQVEALRAVVARTMMETGEWIVPYHRGGIYIAKPPLMYWIIASFSLPAGTVTELSLRLPSALATLARAFVILRWGRRRSWPTAGLYASFLYLCLPLVLEKGTRGEIEMVLAACVMLALFILYESMEVHAGARFARTLAAYAFLGLGVLAKGPPALIFFFGTWLVYQTWRGWRGVRARDHLAGVAVVLLMSLAWILPLIHKVGWELPLKVLQVEAVDRVAQAHRGNEGPLYFYPLSIALAAFPAVVMLPFIQARRLAAQQPAFVFLLCWVAVPVVLFSLSDAKESRYLLPLYPALAVLGGLGLDHLCRRIAARPGAYLRRGLKAAIAAVGLIGPVLALAYERLLPGQGLRGLAWGALWVGLCGVVFVAFSKGRLKATGVALLALLVVLKAIYVTAYLPVREQRKSPREIAARVAARLPQDERLFAFRMMSSAFDYYIDRPMFTVNTVN